MEELNSTYKQINISQKVIEDQLANIDMLEQQILGEESFKAQFLPEKEHVKLKQNAKTS